MSRRTTHGETDAASLDGDQGTVANEDRDEGRLGLSAVPHLQILWDAKVLEATAVFGLVEAILDAVSRQSPILEWMRRRYGSPDFDHAIRRLLLDHLGPLLGLAWLMTKPPLSAYESVELDKSWPHIPAWSLLQDLRRRPDSRMRLAAFLPRPLWEALDRLSVPSEHRRRGNIVVRFARAVFHVARAWYWAMRRLRPRTPRQSPIRLMLRTYATDSWLYSPQVIRDRLRTVDFVLGDGLSIDDVTIWAEPNTPEDRRRALVERGYRLLSSDQVVFGPLAAVSRLLPCLLSYTALLPKLAGENGWFLANGLNWLSFYELWHEVCHQFRPKAFLVHNDLGHLAVARDLVLQQHGCRTIFYQHSSSNLELSADGSHDLSLAYPYLLFDAVVTWGPDHTSMVRAHPNAVGEYWEVGCIWSENARMVAEDAALNRKYIGLLASQVPDSLDRYERRVAVFDSTVSSIKLAKEEGAARGHPDRWVGLYAGVVRLARRLPDVLFVCKPKFPFEEVLRYIGEPGDQVLRDIDQTPNVVVLPVAFETGAVIALTDMALTTSYGTPLIEAIGYGKPAIYYAEKDYLPDSFWRRIPGMVCVTDEELYDRVRHLLWECDKEAYSEYLRTYCMGIEGHFDGLAITRLRQRLLELIDGQRESQPIEVYAGGDG